MKPPFNIFDPILISDRWRLKATRHDIDNTLVTVAEANPRRVHLSFHNPNTSIQIFFAPSTDVTSFFGWQLGGSSVPVDLSLSYAEFGGMVGMQWYASQQNALVQTILTIELIYLPLR